MRSYVGILLVGWGLAVPLHADNAARPAPSRPVSTYSIVARDSITGELGVAVQSHWFSVGAVVPWAASGVGAQVPFFLELRCRDIGQFCRHIMNRS